MNSFALIRDLNYEKCQSIFICFSIYAANNSKHKLTPCWVTCDLYFHFYKCLPYERYYVSNSANIYLPVYLIPVYLEKSKPLQNMFTLARFQLLRKNISKNQWTLLILVHQTGCKVIGGWIKNIYIDRFCVILLLFFNP